MLHLVKNKSVITIEARPEKQRITKIFFISLFFAALFHAIPLIVFNVKSHPPIEVTHKNILRVKEISTQRPSLNNWAEPLPYPSFLP